MSLLMEALKKAERAKQEQANDSTRALVLCDPEGSVGSVPGESEPFGKPSQPIAQQLAEPADTELSLQAAAAPDAGGQSEWPQIAMPEPALEPEPALSFEPAPALSVAPDRAEPVLELTLSTVSSAAGEPPAPVKVLETATDSARVPVLGDPKTSVGSVDSTQESARPDASKPKPAPSAAAQDDRKIAAARQKAKSVFGAKQAPRSRALLLAGAALAVVAGCAVFGWYYWQIISGSSAVMPPGMVQQSPQAQQPEIAASVPPAAAPSPAQAADSTPPSGSPTPGHTTPHDLQVIADRSPLVGHTTPHDLQVIADRSPLGQTTRGQGTRTREKSYAEAKSPPPANTPAPKDDTAIRIRQSTATNQVNPLLGKAYQSFIAGDIETSQQQYHKMLQQEPNNRDALLGMAAIALSRKQAGQSAAYYGKLLELDPADPDALAGLISLQGQTDPVQSESRLKKILAQNPQANAVHFALGNLYSQQSRWAEAQQAFFRAYSSAPGNADYAYNLAVSLDHLNQGKPALDYYQRALALGQSGPANFDKASVHNRVKELAPLAGE